MKHSTLRQDGDAALESQRWQAEQASRPELSGREQAESLFHAMKAAVADGRLDDAKAHALALRPLLGFLPA